jgi:NRAMP (natural resistance-associated macrophage protein)-like metal ion transporter
VPPEASAPRRSRRSRLLVFLSVLGPGLIAAAAGNEAGGVITYSSIGAQFGYSMLWLLLLSTFSLIVAQEMGTRMGVVTGKGLADLIREEFGVRVAVFAMVILFIANLATTISEFAGITAAVELFLPPGLGWVRYVLIPGVALLLWLMVTRGTYRKVERVFLAMCSVFFAYVVAAVLSHPDWSEVARQSVHPQLPSSPGYVTMAIQLIGTTIAPWMQFYVQSSVRDKGTRPDNYAEARLDVFLGSTLSNIISLFIIVACAKALYFNPLHGPASIELPREAAHALDPLGRWGLILFGVGLFTASAVGAVVVPLSTAYAVTEAIGSESGLGRKVREAPLFIGIFTALLVISVPIVLLTDEKDLFALIKKAQLINGILLPVILVLMLRLINNRRIMGKYVNGPGFNIVAWLTVGLVVCLSIASLFAQ